MLVKDITNTIEQIAPVMYQESYDNCGIQVGNPDAEVNGILLTLDVTEAVLEEAIENGCNMIVAHHPLIFSGLKRIAGRNYVERVVQQDLWRNTAGPAVQGIYGPEILREALDKWLCRSAGKN